MVRCCDSVCVGFSFLDSLVLMFVMFGVYVDSVLF